MRTQPKIYSFLDQSSIARLLLCAALGLAFGATANAGSTLFYTGGVYTQNFDSLPNPGTTSVNTANPVTINGVEYTFNGGTGQSFDFAAPIDSSGTTAGSTGGLGLSSTMPGWYGGGATAIKVGATFGDQTTGGVLDFGPASSSNRSLGLIATSTSGATYFGLAIVNNTGAPISLISTAFTWEFWKQGGTAKTVSFDYTVDNGNALNLISAATSGSAVNLSNSPTEPTGAVGPVDGTNPANQSAFSSGAVALNTALQPGGTLWLTFQQPNASSGGQGFGIDNFSFQAVPEPSTWAMVVSGFGLLVGAHRLRRRQS